MYGQSADKYHKTQQYTRIVYNIIQLNIANNLVDTDTFYYIWMIELPNYTCNVHMQTE